MGGGGLFQKDNRRLQDPWESAPEFADSMRSRQPAAKV